MKLNKLLIGLALLPAICFGAKLTSDISSKPTTAGPLVFQEGVHYRVLPQKKSKVKSVQKKQTGKEVIEFFGYGCPHCYQFEPALNQWIAKKPTGVKFRRIPVVFHADWEMHAKLFYTAQGLSVLNEPFHQAVFKSIHETNNNLTKKEALAEFFKQKGVEPSQFNKMFNSFSIANQKMGKVAKAKKEAKQYQVRSVPTIAIKVGNKQYVTNITMAGDSDKMLKIVDYLLGLNS